MSAFTTWTSKHPPENVFLLQWDHIEAERDGKKDIRRFHVWCDAESLKGEIEHLERRKMEYSVTEYSKTIELNKLLAEIAELHSRVEQLEREVEHRSQLAWNRMSAAEKDAAIRIG